MRELFHRGTWLVACSAGPDSMALLHMCLKEGIDIAVAHVNYHHQICADQEEEYIRAFCDQNHIPLHVLNKPFQWTGNFEAEARRWRYQFFADVIQQHNYMGVMTGHHEDDLIETFLLQQDSGRIPEYWGLSDETMIMGVVVQRPLLNYTKQDLQNYCDENRIQYFIDETNADKTYARNKIRIEVVNQLTPFERSMIRQEINALNAEWKERRCRVRTEIREEVISLKRYRQLEEVDRLTLLRFFLEESTTISKKYLMQIDSQIMTKDDFMIQFRDYFLINHEGYLKKWIEPSEYEDTYQSIDELISGLSSNYKIDEDGRGVDAVTIHDTDWPITIRNYQSGDQIAMRFGHKKVQRFFLDRHIPLWQRSRWPIVLNCNNEIILVPGLGCDINHYSIKPNCYVVQLLNMKEHM